MLTVSFDTSLISNLHPSTGFCHSTFIKSLPKAIFIVRIYSSLEWTRTSKIGSRITAVSKIPDSFLSWALLNFSLVLLSANLGRAYVASLVFNCVSAGRQKFLPERTETLLLKTNVWEKMFTIANCTRNRQRICPIVLSLYTDGLQSRISQ